MNEDVSKSSVANKPSSYQQVMTAMAEPVMKGMAEVQRAMQPIVDAISPLAIMALDIQAALSPIVSIVEQFNAQFGETIAILAKNIRPVMAIDILRKNQFVYWYRLQEEFVDRIIEAEDVDGMLLEFETQNDNAIFNGVVDGCVESNLLGVNKRRFTQAVEAYRMEAYDISAVALLSILDGLLSKCSGENPRNTSMLTHAKKILEKLELGDEINTEEYAGLILYMTFSSAITSLTQGVHFDEDEPKELNRHWIMHGRSNRVITQLDCIKLIHCIYGAILIDKLERDNSIAAD